MPIDHDTPTTSPEERQSLIQSLPCFASLTPPQSIELSNLSREISYSLKEAIVTQDELIDSVYIIVRGEAEVTAEMQYKKKVTSVPLAILHAGESIGLNDTGFFSSTGKRTATVTALSELLLLRIDLKDLHAFLKKNNLESSMYVAAEQMLRMRLIKQSLPFGKISHERLQWLCEQVEELSISAGTILFHQGDQGDKCYLVRTGKIEILAEEPDGSSRQLAVLKPPTLFGEATLITQQPRNATARALEDTQLLAIAFTCLTELWEKEQKVTDMFMTLMVDRSRPVRNEKVNEFPRSTADGQTIVILKNPETASYFKLSQEGWYLWQQMNGKQTLLEITLALANQYKVFSPQMVTALISKLAQTNFVGNVSIESPVSEKEPTALKKWISRICGILSFRMIFKKADAWLAKAYQRGVRFLFTPVGQIVLLAVMIFGFIVFLKTENHIVQLLRVLHAGLIFTAMIPLTLLTAVLHELGHAFAVKAFGREVHSMGLGWNWTAPVAFTDMTDMWLADRWPRIAVNMAGLGANVLVSGVCALLVLVMPSEYMQAFLWLFALTTYIKGFAMLNPSQNMDGYYIMLDVFGQPQLRYKATVWAMKILPASFKKPSLFLKHGPEIGYWLCCIVFLASIAIIALYVQGFILKLLGMTPPNLFSALILPAISVAVPSVTLISDIRKQEG